MKTYSVTVKDKNSKHNVPVEMVIKFSTQGKRITAIENATNRWAETKYGFIISEEELAKYTPLYRYTGGTSYDEVYIVDLQNISEWDKKERKWYLAAEDWTFVYKTKETYLNKEVIFLRIYRNLPKTPNKLFTNVEEMLAYYKKENDKRNAKIIAKNELYKATNNGPLQFETPKRKIVSINKATDHVRNAKVGDTIYGVIRVLNYNGKNVMSTQSAYVNYVDVYLNDTKINLLPMSTFGDIMSKNFVLE